MKFGVNHIPTSYLDGVLKMNSLSTFPHAALVQPETPSAVSRDSYLVSAWTRGPLMSGTPLSKAAKPVWAKQLARQPCLVA